jgi:hypothetical protein
VKRLVDFRVLIVEFTGLGLLFLSVDKKPLRLLALFAVALFLLNFMALSPRKPFLRLYHNITARMPIDEVDRLYQEYYPRQDHFSRLF